MITAPVPSPRTPQDSGGAVVAQPGRYELHVGDPLVQIGVDLYGGFGLLRTLGVYAVAKAPVASVESGIGTGEWDYGAGASLGLGVGRTTFIADASYWVVGDLPDLPLRNTLVYGLSVGHSCAAGRWSVFGSVMGATATIARTEAPIAIGLGVGYAPRSTSGLTAGMSAGLTASTPDFSAYLGWHIALAGDGF